MARIKWRSILDFDYATLDKTWKLDLIQYMKQISILNSMPLAVKRVVSWFLNTKKYKLEWTTLVQILFPNTQSVMTDETTEEVVEETTETPVEETPVAEPTEEKDEEVANEEAEEAEEATE